MVYKGMIFVNGVPTQLASGDVLYGHIAFAIVDTYSLMIAMGTPGVMTIIRVKSDEDKGLTKTEYHWWPAPDGGRTYKGDDDQVSDLSQTGTMISDGSQPWANDDNQAAYKVFDGNINTYYRSGQANPWVGRNFGTAKKVNSVTLTAIQDSNNASNLNGAQVQYSLDGSSWTNIGSAVSGVTSANYATPVVVSFAATTAQYWRVQLTGNGWLAEMKLMSSRP